MGGGNVRGELALSRSAMHDVHHVWMDGGASSSPAEGVGFMTTSRRAAA